MISRWEGKLEAPSPPSSEPVFLSAWLISNCKSSHAPMIQYKLEIACRFALGCPPAFQSWSNCSFATPSKCWWEFYPAPTKIRGGLAAMLGTSCVRLHRTAAAHLEAVAAQWCSQSSRRRNLPPQPPLCTCCCSAYLAYEEPAVRLPSPQPGPGLAGLGELSAVWFQTMPETREKGGHGERKREKMKKAAEIYRHLKTIDQKYP